MGTPASGGETRSVANDDAEIELTLIASPDAIKKLSSSSVVRGRAEGRARTKQLLSVYYDTPDQRLHKRGITLRVRKVGRRFVQTVKTNVVANGSVLTRGEWEVEVGSLAPDLQAIGDPEVRGRVGLVLPGELTAQFATKIRRQARLLYASENGGVASAVEMACDVGSVDADSRKAEVSEIELELLRGRPESLYRLALELHDVAPMRIQTLTKAQRGYALALGEPPAWHKAAPVNLTEADTVESALKSTMHGCIAQWTDNDAAAHDGTDPEGVHQLRVAMRRLRSALSLFRKALPVRDRTWINDEARWLIQELGPARDLDVFATETLEAVRKARTGDSATATLGEIIEADRQDAYDQVRAAIESPRYTAFFLRLGLWIEHQGWRDDPDGAALEWQQRPVVELADKLLAKRHKTVRKAGRYFDDLDTEARHEVRITLKKLRYATEFLASLYPEKHSKPYRQAAARLQDALGHLNDVSVAEHLLGELIARHHNDPRLGHLQLAAGQVIGWFARVLEDTEPEIVESWHAFAARKPFWHTDKD